MGWKELGLMSPSTGLAMQSQPLAQRNAFKSCLRPINNGIVLLKQPKRAGKSEERPRTGQTFIYLGSKTLLLDFDVVNILFGPHQ